MSAPKLTVASSGYGGRGYKSPWTGEVVPGITTVLGAINHPAILQWSVDQVAAYAAYSVEDLVGRDEEQRFRMLRFYHSRAKESDFDDPMKDLSDAHNGVLNELASLGTAVHDWIEADLNDWMEPDIYRPEQEEMVVAYLEWRAEHDVEVYRTEATVFGEGYAGTADLFAKIDGVNTLLDIKTSRAVRDSHIAQLGALGAAHTLAVEVPEGASGATGFKPRKSDKEFSSWWVEDVVPPIQQYQVLQVRPRDVDKFGVESPAFCVQHTIDPRQIDAGYELFRGALQVRHGQKKLKDSMKGVG